MNLIGQLIIFGIIGATLLFLLKRYGYLWFSPKTMIKKLWKEIYDLEELKKSFDMREYVNDVFVDSWQKPLDKQIDTREKLINAMLEYYFDPEKDEDYIKENRP